MRRTAAPLGDADRGQVDRGSSSVTIRETDARGRGVFAVRPLARGETVLVGKPVAILPARAWNSLQTDVSTHVQVDAPFESVNHSCGPNCGVKPNAHRAYDLIAIRDVEAGEEITFDYCTTEWVCVGFEDCHCGCAQCRRVVRGAKYLPRETLESYGDYLAPYLRRSG